MGVRKFKTIYLLLWPESFQSVPNIIIIYRGNNNIKEVTIKIE